MALAHYPVLGLSSQRCEWFTTLTTWSTSGALPVEFTKCLSVADLQARLGGLRSYVALFIDAQATGVDRDLIDRAHRCGVTVFVVGAADAAMVAWSQVGVDGFIELPLEPSTVVDTLAQLAGNHHDDTDSELADILESNDALFGNLVAVCGPGGTGASVVSMVLAEAAGSKAMSRELVLLADFARNAEQGVFHDAPSLIPGVEELVALCRAQSPTRTQVRELTFELESRNYQLLLGQRRRDSWTAMPPAATRTAIEALHSAFQLVVADITADFETERDSGSIDIQERNALSLETAKAATCVVCVGTPGLKGLHALGRTIRSVSAVTEAPVVPLVNHAPKRGLERAAITKAFASITSDVDGLSPLRFLANVDVEGALRDVGPLPAKLVSAASDLVPESNHLRVSIPEQPDANQVRPGSLGIDRRQAS
jgi:hypothetical protein